MRKSEGANTAFRDVLMLALMAFVVAIILMLSWINPKEQQDGQKIDLGFLIVEIFWPESYATDVDLWVMAPNERPVGYSNKGGKTFNLLRDDLGNMADETNRNHEISVARSAPPGEYIVNLHLYRNDEHKLPIPVTVIVTQTMSDSPAKTLLTEKVELDSVGQELTVVRFRLDTGGHLINDSVHNLFKALRAMK